MAGAFWDSEETVARVDKAGTKGTYYLVKKVSKGKRVYVDLREHYDRKDGFAQHTTKGSAIPVEAAEELIAALQQAIEG